MDITSLIANHRLINQQLSATEFSTPAQLVAWMGAMQAQDFGMAKWAIGTRIQSITDKQVEDALNKGKILRTHILRPTWHFVAAEDIRWMLQLTGPRLMATAHTYDKILGISQDIFLRTTPIIIKALEKHGSLTRQELGEYIKQEGVYTGDNWLAHFAMHAELDGLICSGVIKGKQQTYRLLDEVVPKDNYFDRDEALYKLAVKYFKSHSPASLPDFAWWSGLTTTDAKKSLEMIKNEFSIQRVGEVLYVFPNSQPNSNLNGEYFHLLPSWDEYLVSYKDRSHVLVDEHYSKVISSKNGLFKPAISQNGKIVGSWKKLIKNKRISVNVELFEPLSKNRMDKLNDQIIAFENFINS